MNNDGPQTMTELGARLEQELAWAVPFVFKLLRCHSMHRVEQCEAVSLAGNGLILAMQTRKDGRAPWPAWARIKIRSYVLDHFRSLRFGRRSKIISCVYIEDMTGINSEGERMERLHPALIVEADKTDFLGTDNLWTRAARILPRRHFQVVCGIYMHELTQETLAACMGITASRVSQIHNRALQKLRQHIA